MKNNKYHLKAIFLICLALLICMPATARSFEQYRNETRWPKIQQSWYFDDPYDVAVGSNNYVYVADGSRIAKFTYDGHIVTQWDSIQPDALAVGRGTQDTIYVSRGSKVELYSSDGSSMGTWGSFGSGDIQFNNPTGLTVDSNRGYVYVADTMNHRIQKLDTSGALISVWGWGVAGGSQYEVCTSDCMAGVIGSGDGQFNQPEGIAVDSIGNVYVADRYNYRVMKFGSDGTFIANWGQIDGTLTQPTGISIGSDDRVYVISFGSAKIYVVDPQTGALIPNHKWGGQGTGDREFHRSNGLTVYSDGVNDHILVADTGNDRIQRLSADGIFETKWGPGNSAGIFIEPEGVAIYNDGTSDYIFVADSLNNRIQKFDTGGNVLEVWDSATVGVSFDHPRGIAVYKSGTDVFIYVVDSWNNRILKFNLSGSLLLEWGSECKLYDNQTGCTILPGESELGDKQFHWPEGIAIGSIGATDYVYIVDSRNHRIQKFDLNGNFIGKWGSKCIISTGSGCNDLSQGAQLDGDGQFLYPKGIAVDSSGFVYVVDYENSRIQKFDPNGDYLLKWGSYGAKIDGKFYRPTGIAVDRNNLVFVADTRHDRIQVFTPDGIFLSKFGEPGTYGGQFTEPHYISISTDSGLIYVTDWGNNRVQVFRQIEVSNSKAIIVAGGGASYGNRLWEATQMNTDHAYSVLDSRGFSKESIYYLSDDIANRGDIIDHASTKNQLQWAIETWAADAEKLFLYITDHGGDGVVKLNDNETLEASTLNTWLNTLQDSNCAENVMLDEDFESPLSGWNVVDNAGTGAVWRFDDPKPRGNDTGGSGLFAIVDSDYEYTVDVDTELRTPVMDMTGKSKVVFEFKTNFNHYAYGKFEIADVDVSVNGAAGPWTNVWRRAGSDYGSSPELVDISSIAADESNVMVRFHYYNANYEWWWKVDDVKITAYENACPDHVTVIYDACRSGSFVDTLKVPPAQGKERIIVTGTESDKPAYFVTQGSVSFSSFFWSNVFIGKNIKESFDNASVAISQALGQNPQLEDNFPGNSLADSTYIGSSAQLQEELPQIQNVTFTNPGSTSALLTAENVTDIGDGVGRVWAIIIPPNYTPDASDNPIDELPYIDLIPDPQNPGNWTATYDGFDLEQPYDIYFFASDRSNNISNPFPATYINVSGSLKRRRAIIIEGSGGLTAEQSTAIRSATLVAYNSLDIQGYADNSQLYESNHWPTDDIYLMTHDACTCGIDDAFNTKQKLQDAITQWAYDDAYDVVLYLIGSGDSSSFFINDTETVSASELKGWLNTLQSHISGKVTVVYDGPESGSYISALTPQAGKERILIASTENEEWSVNPNNSFSSNFWSMIKEGRNVLDAFNHARNAMLFVSDNWQDARINDNGNSINNDKGNIIGNEPRDGVLAGTHTIGRISYGGNYPSVGTLAPDTTLNGQVSALIWADNITTTGAISSVWAEIIPPSGVKIVPALELTDPEGDNRYEGMYLNFTQYGTYKIIIYALDSAGNRSVAKQTTVKQLDYVDVYEDDDEAEQANWIGLGNIPQEHNIHDAGDKDWVMFYGLDGETYRVEVTNSGSADLVLEVLDANRQPVQGPVDTIGDEEIEWTINTGDGLYYVRVSINISSSYGADTGYELSVYIPDAPSTTFLGRLWGTVYAYGTNNKISMLANTVGGKIYNQNASPDCIISWGDVNGDYAIECFPGAGVTINFERDGYSQKQVTYTFVAGVDSPRTDIYMLPVASPSCNDNDGDGYGSSGDPSCPNGIAVDCNDNDPEINPGASEVCTDSIDNDCSGIVNDNADTDGDGMYDCSDPCPLTPPARIDGNPAVYYTNIGQTYTYVANSDTIQSHDWMFSGDVTFDSNVNVTIEGGYDCNYSGVSVTTPTVIKGDLLISDGIVTISDFKIIP